MSEYRWKWGNPDRIGIWAFGGHYTDKHMPPKFSAVRSIENLDPGWWCFVMDFPEILPPKQPVTEVLWVKLPDQHEGKFSTEAVWAKQGETLLSTEKSTWVPTNVMRSYER